MTDANLDVAAVAGRLTRAQREAVCGAFWSDSSGVWHPEGWFVNADRRVRYNLCRAGIVPDYLRPAGRLTPLGLLVRAHLLAGQAPC